MLDVPNPRLEHWLTRLATLSAADWGWLDAAGRAFGGHGLGAPVRRARLLAQLMRAIPGVPPTVVTTYVFGRDLWDRAMGTSQPVRRASRTHRDTSARVDPVSRAYYETCQRRLEDIVARAPGRRAVQEASGWKGVQSVLHFAWVALALAPELPPDALDTLYAPLEPVIPLASLSDAPPSAAVAVEAAG